MPGMARSSAALALSTWMVCTCVAAQTPPAAGPTCDDLLRAAALGDDGAADRLASGCTDASEGERIFAAEVVVARRALGAEALLDAIEASHPRGVEALALWRTRMLAASDAGDDAGALRAARAWRAAAIELHDRAEEREAALALLELTALVTPDEMDAFLESLASGALPAGDPLWVLASLLRARGHVRAGDLERARSAIHDGLTRLEAIRDRRHLATETLALEVAEASLRPPDADRADLSDALVRWRAAVLRDARSAEPRLKLSLLLPWTSDVTEQVARGLSLDGHLAAAGREAEADLDLAIALRAASASEWDAIDVAETRARTLAAAAHLRARHTADAIEDLRAASALAAHALDHRGAASQRAITTELRRMDDVLGRALLEAPSAELTTLALRAALDRRARASASDVLPPTSTEPWAWAEIRRYVEGPGTCGPPEASTTDAPTGLLACLRDRGLDAFVVFLRVEHDPLGEATEARYLAIVLRADGGLERVPLGPAATLDDAARALSLALRRDDGAWETASRALDEELAPLRSALGPVHRVALTPEGWLARVPFGALSDGRELWIDRYDALVLTPSPRHLFPTPPVRGEAIVMGAPRGHEPIAADLPGARREIEAVARTLDATAWLGRSATEARLFEALTRPVSVLHLATHGAPAWGPSGRAALLLSPSDERTSSFTPDGFLTPGEILASGSAGLDLVVLSACDSGTGDPVPGEGVAGLRLAFLTAGARSVVSSLWPVDDESTRELLTALHRELARGAAREDALRAAELRVRRRRPHPHHWSAFVLEGSTGPLALAR